MNDPYSEAIDLTVAPVANRDPAISTGYSTDVILAMVSHVGPGFWAAAMDSGRIDLAHRDNHLPDHAAKMEAARAVLKRYGLRTRRVSWDSKLRGLTIYPRSST